MFLPITLLFVHHVLGTAPNELKPLTESTLTTMVSAAPAVAGRVVTETGAGLPGVVVAIQGTPQATSTNASGDFLLTLNNAKSVLIFKCQGYRDQTLAVAAGNSLTVKMFALNRPAPSNLAAAAAAPAPEATEAGVASGAPTVLSFSEELPTFPGGDAAYRAYMGHNAHFPEEALAKGLSGTVYVSFVVDEQGRIIDAEIAKGCGNGFDQEALRVIRLMPWWNPGRQAGKAVRVSRILPVPFVFRERP